MTEIANRRRSSCRAILALGAALQLVACAGTYVTPGAPVNLGTLARTDGDIATALQREPTASFPAHLAVARVQSAGYAVRGNQCLGQGDYCLVAARDVETDADLARISALPAVAAVAPLNILVLPSRMTSVRDLRLGAATLKCDILLVYTFNTRFNIDSVDIGPLALISLGFLPNQKARVTTTASAALFDVRTGFVYGLAESTSTEEQRASVWSSNSAIDSARASTEAAAFHGMVAQIEKTWGGIVAEHGAMGSK